MKKRIELKRLKYIGFLMALLLLAGGVMNSVWATNVTYHVLTLPIDPTVYDYHMKPEITGKRLEAFKVTVNSQSTLGLPAQYKSPLATGFTYYSISDPNITKSVSAVTLFENNSSIKGFTYEVNGGASQVAEGTTLSGNTAEYYVVYTYNSSNTIAKLDGTVNYNIKTIGYVNESVEVEKGFIAYNRGRNNRPAVIHKDRVSPAQTSDEDFTYIADPGASITTYWSSNDNKNKRAEVESQFYFMFKFEGLDPYNIIIRTAYAKDTTYIEKNEGTSNFVYKWYKEGSLFAVSGNNNCYIASDEHKNYNIIYNTSTYPTNPTNLEEGAGLGYISRPGNYHGHSGVIWNSFALLNNSKSTGYVFMGTRTVNGEGATQNSLYYLKEANTCNNLQIQSGDATNNLTIEGLYPIKKVSFKVVTPFYAGDPSTAHIVTVPEWTSQYTIENYPIESRYMPEALKRKYIEFNGKFYKDAACTQEITHFYQAVEDPTEGYQVYVGYNVSATAPKFLSPSADYTTATWYELTDEGSVQESGRKIKYDTSSATYKNNGANGEYVKESEFALVGDPYELKVLYRKGTETAGSNTYVTLSTHDTWDMPDDETDGSFLLHEYKGTGYWCWNAGHATADVAYGSDLTIAPNLDNNAQTVILNFSGLDVNKYYGITAEGEGSSQIVSVTPAIDNVQKVTGTTMTVVVKLAANTSGADKTMTITFQEYDKSDGSSPFESPSAITITQGTSASSFAGNTIDYSTTNSTRVKVLELPKYTYTYNIVDLSGRIAVKASAEQTIFSRLSLASIPSIIVSPFILDETVTFYDSYTDRNTDGVVDRRDFHNPSEQTNISETPNVADDIYVTYTVANLDVKPIKLSQEQEFNVVLNGQYLWYDSNDGFIKTSSTPSTDDLKLGKYLWKLRNRDPYAMLIDNKGAREHLGVTGDEQVTMYDADGTPRSETREKGAWVTLASIANEGVLSFTKRRSTESESEGLIAQRFVAKASTAAGVYEVMVAAGVGVDASTTYYNIGRPSDNTVQIYDNAHYTHGNDVLKFHLEQTIGYIYHLIDKSKHNLLTMTSQNPDLALPADYQSPLVATYHYYDPASITETIVEGVKEYTVNSSAVELTTLASLNAIFDAPVSSNEDDWEAAAEGRKLEAISYDNMIEKAKQLGETDLYYYNVNNGAYYYSVNVTKPFYNQIYVTYDANDIVKFNDNSPYTLKFLEPFAEGYYLEDGNDGLTTGKHQAVYPYTNGDGNLNIYSEDMKGEQFGGGSSTRPRWIWYFDSEDNDPYHVKIRSRSTISYSGISHPTYLTTYAVHFNQDASPSTQHIVTGGTLPGIASVAPTEYMILGSAGAYKLMTTAEISDGESSERRKVTSFEQYWKTYNMVKQKILGVSTDVESDDPATWVVPTEDDPSTPAPVDESTYRATLAERGWHSYNAIASAVRWNGYTDDGRHNTKIVENLEHWYQTFEMGNGTFDIESVDIPPFLVLLDLHGWEIMRLPLPTANYPEGEDELEALRAYDSPMVKEYKFYSQATKASGCHKYTLRMQNDGAERDQIKVNGEHYTSTSLGDLPPRTASGVISSGAFNDQFVTYTVKEEYAESYSYSFTDNGDGTYSESGSASKYLILLASRFMRVNDTGASNYISKPIYEASNPVGGNIYDAILDPQTATVSQTSTAVDANPRDGNIDDINLWYMQPNLNIDKEMGIKWGASDDISLAEPLSEYGTKKKYKDITGFDPYNIQLKNVGNNKFMTSHMVSTRLRDGIMIGNYEGSGGSTDITLVAEDTSYPDPLESTGSEGYDHTNIAMTNQTFMAVSDANGNLQLMPRFDHTKRVNLVNNKENSHTTLQLPVNHAKASAESNSSMGAQTIFFVRPQRLEYHIIDNEGKESIRYKRAGDEYPAVTAHFKSPVAKDFTYYTGLAVHGEPEEITPKPTPEQWDDFPAEFKRTATTASLMNTQINLLPTSGTYYYQVGLRGVFNYYTVEVTKGLLEQQIEGALAAETLTSGNVYVRYDYDADADHDADQILEGKWFTVKLADKDLQADGTIVTTVGEAQGTGVNLYTSSKPGTVDENEKVWQWKFLAVLANPISDYYEKPDPYNVRIYNRNANYTDNPSVTPNPMNISIKVPNETTGANHFTLLSHPDGGYALAVAGLGTYDYTFLNGADMTTEVAATTAVEPSFTQKAGIISTGSKLVLNSDVIYNFEYRVVNKASKLAVTASQNNDEANAHEFFPHLPEAAQTPLLREKDYKYYGSAIPDDNGTDDDPSDDTYTIIPYSIIYTLYGGYDDVVWVQYDDYHVDSTEFKVPNRRNATGIGQVARDQYSVDVSMNIDGDLPYNIIWYNDNMMQSTDGSDISDGGSHVLSGEAKYVWYFTGNDPYALKIKHKGGSYVDGDGTMVNEAAGAKEFMLLKKSGYDYGILQETGGANKLTFGDVDFDPETPNTCGMTTGDPTKFIIFGLSVHDLIYHLVIAKTCINEEIEKDKSHTIVLDPSKYVDIPYRETQGGSETFKRIYGSTQRDLTTGTPAGATYQLGETVNWGGENHTYCHDAGAVSIGDDLSVPNVFNRPNCTFDFYIAGIYDGDDGDALAGLEAKYKGLKLNKLMEDEDLIDHTVVVNVVYSFDKGLATNNGMDFVRSINDKCWYTFETQGEEPYLAHYTNAWGLQSMAGRETRYTNDYLWTPVGDVYGFKLYNRYMIKNSDGSDKVMTFAGSVANNTNLLVAEPGTGDYTSGNEIFELLASNTPGYFRVHPVVNISGDQYYVRRDDSGDNYAKLSTTSCDWTFGLSRDLMQPYYDRAGYVGGLTAAGKTAYEAAESKGTIMDIQHVVYDDDNIITFTPGYYRLHNQPGVSGISPVRYASGYLHEMEKTAVSGGIPMHFYSKQGVNTTFETLGSGFTQTIATRGEIPVPATEEDPSSIFYLSGGVTNNKTISTATMSTQGLNVSGNKMTTGNGTTFTMIDIGGAVFLIADELDPATRQYFCFDQTSNVYDLKFEHNSPTDDAKWCLQPANHQGLKITTNDGGDDYFYSTFYAPYDVLLPADDGGLTYNAYTCKAWHDEGVNPIPVPEKTIDETAYAEGKFIPAGTPAIIRTNDESGTITLTLPSNEPSDDALSGVFTGSYLDQLLAVDAENDVYTFGLPFTSDVTIDRNTGEVTAALAEKATTGVGFYINATPNKEASAQQSLWLRNNRYVLHNKIYYRAGSSSGASAPERDVQFVPVLFDEGGEEEQPEETQPQPTRVGDGCVYDILGRKVASAEEVKAGTWYRHLSPGVYIVNGQKVFVGVGRM